MTRTNVLAVLLALAAGTPGCILVEQAEYEKLVQQAAKSQQEIQQLKKASESLQAAAADQRKQISTLQALGPKRLERLYYVSEIQMSRYTGGVDTDGKGGHDAIKVYMVPVDQDGSVIKAAGAVTIQLYDLGEPAGKNLIGEYNWPVEKVGAQWSSSMLTYHYSFVCPWQHGPPKHDEITVRVEFTDYLTGKTFTAQKLCTITLPVPQSGQAAPVPPREKPDR
jgi:hypothetical protein